MSNVASTSQVKFRKVYLEVDTLEDLIAYLEKYKLIAPRSDTLSSHRQPAQQAEPVKREQGGLFD